MVLDIKDVSFSYGFGSVRILEDINLQISVREFFGIIGPNAAGKTTLLRLILGLEQPDSGCIKVLGNSPSGARNRIGYVPQRPGFRRDFPITVLETVRLGLLGAEQDGKSFRSMLDRAIDSLQLGDIAGRRIATLSGGQMQRVLLARALVCDPVLLILDEPTANIDLIGEHDIFRLLKCYNEDMTIILVSHDIAFIAGYVNRVGCLNRTLTCHRTEAVSDKTIRDLYGAPVAYIDHTVGHHPFTGIIPE